MDKPMNGTVHELSEYAKHQLDLENRSAEYVRKLNETSSISYVDDNGYLVRRNPEGIVTRIPGVKRVNI